MNYLEDIIGQSLCYSLKKKKKSNDDDKWLLLYVL